MERLTVRDEHGNAFASPKHDWMDMRQHDALLIDRLADYEDTGLTPEEIIKLDTEVKGLRFNLEIWQETAKVFKNELQAYKDAEEQGLLIKLPCKVGDTVYVNKRCLRSLEGYGIHTKYVCGEVVATVKTKRQKLIKIRLLIHPNVKYHERFPFSSIGRTVFLTREEAEEALRKGGRACLIDV